MSARLIALSTAGLAAATVGLAKIVGRAERRQAPPAPAPRPPAPEPVADVPPAPPAPPAADVAGDLALPVVRGARGRFTSKRNPPAAAAT